MRKPSDPKLDLRTPSGTRRYWKGGTVNLPTVEQLAAALASARDCREYGFVATCACCETKYDIPEMWEYIKKFGVCANCLAFVQGRADGVVVERPPTLEEALAAPAEKVAFSEILVMRNALRDLLKEPMGHVYVAEVHWGYEGDAENLGVFSSQEKADARCQAYMLQHPGAWKIEPREPTDVALVQWRRGDDEWCLTVTQYTINKDLL